MYANSFLWQGVFYGHALFYQGITYNSKTSWVVREAYHTSISDIGRWVLVANLFCEPFEMKHQ